MDGATPPQLGPRASCWQQSREGALAARASCTREPGLSAGLGARLPMPADALPVRFRLSLLTLEVAARCPAPRLYGAGKDEVTPESGQQEGVPVDR